MPKLQLARALLALECRMVYRLALVCQIVRVERVMVANICPLRVTRMPIISPDRSSSAAHSFGDFFNSGGGAFSASPPRLCPCIPELK